MPVLAVNDDAGHCLGPAIGDANLEIHQFHVVDAGLIGPKVLAKRFCQSVDRAAVRPTLVHAVTDRHQLAVTDLDHDHGFGQADHPVIAVLPPLDRHPVALDLKEDRAKAQFAPGDQLKTGLRAVIGIALVLTRFHDLDDLAKARILWVDRNPRRLQPCPQVRLTRLIGHRDHAFIADQPRVDVFIGGRIFQDRTRVQARLVGKGAGPDISR